MSNDATDHPEDTVTTKEIVEWNTWRLVNALAMREAIEVCSIILRSTAVLVTSFQGPDPKKFPLSERAWDLLREADALVEKEFSAWVAACVGQAALGSRSTDIGVLFTHATHAAALLFEERVEKHLQWQQKGMLAVWLGEPIMRAMRKIRDAVRSGTGLNPNEDVAVYGIGKRDGSVEQQIIELLRRASNPEETVP